MNSDVTRSDKQNPSFSSDDFAKALDKHDYKQYEKGQVVKGKVFKYESDGAYIDFGGKAPGFIPNDEVPVGRVADISQLLPLNEELEFLVINSPDSDGQLKLSRRLLDLQKTWKKLAKKAEEGDTVDFRVTGANQGGVLGEVEGLRGFIPKSHLVEKNNLDSLKGKILKAVFLEVDQDHKRLVLSHKDAIRTDAVKSLKIGDLKEGVVSNFKHYGLFVEIDGVLTGLLHIKEITGRRIEELPIEFVGKDQKLNIKTIKVMVISIGEKDKRISLSTKILENHDGEILDNFSHVMETAEERAEKARDLLLSGKYLTKSKKDDKKVSQTTTEETQAEVITQEETQTEVTTQEKTDETQTPSAEEENN